MAGVNGRRVIAGGLLAGLVLNVGHVLGELATAAEGQRMIERLGLAVPGEGAMLTIALLGFLVGTLSVWLYAAIQPRYGAGVQTALIAGGVVWILACIVPNLSVLAFGILTPSHAWIASAVDLILVPAATVAGAYVYRESEPAGAVSTVPAAATRG